MPGIVLGPSVPLTGPGDQRTLERIIIDPWAEDSTNGPLELTGRTPSHTVSFVSADYALGDRKSLFAGSIDSIGEQKSGGTGKPQNRTIPVTVWLGEEESLDTATNLCRNPKGHALTAGWTNSSLAEFGVQTMGVLGGNVLPFPRDVPAEVALKMRGAAGGARAYFGFDVTNGQTYTISAWIYLGELSATNFVIEARDAADTVKATGVAITQVGQWGHYTLTFAADSTATWRAAFRQLGTGTVTAYVTAVMIEHAATASPYFDGDTPGCVWNGTPHFSTSVRLGAEGKRFIGALRDIEQKIEKLAAEGGTYKRILPSGDEISFDVIDAQMGGEWDKIFNQHRQQVTFTLTCAPYGRGAERTTTFVTTDQFNTDTIGSGQWKFDIGSTTIAVSSGQLVPSDTTAKRMYRKVPLADARATLKINSAGIATELAEVILKRLGSSDWLSAGLNGSGQLAIRKDDSGSVSNLSTPAAVSLTNSTDYWIRFNQTGNVLTVEIFTVDPYQVDPPPAPVASATYTLTGADATKYGTGVEGNPGFRVTPATTASRYDVFRVEADSFFGGSVIDQNALRGTIIGTIPGSAPARGRLQLHDEAGQDRLWFQWGVQSRYYSASGQADLAYHAEGRTPLGGSVSVTATGAVSGKAVKTGDVQGDPIAMLSTNDAPVAGSSPLTHVGTFRVFARVQDQASHAIAFSYAQGDSRYWTTNEERVPTAELSLKSSDWAIVDLGVIELEKAIAGAQQWEGRLLVWTTDGSLKNGKFFVDNLTFLPITEGSGEARGDLRLDDAPTAFVAHDEFDQPASSALDGYSLPQGGVWTHVGGSDGQDFDVPGSSTGVARRTLSFGDADLNTGRYESAGSTAYTAIDVRADAQKSAIEASDVFRMGVYARLVDVNNWIMAVLVAGSGNYPNIGYKLRVYKRVAGTVTKLGGDASVPSAAKQGNTLLGPFATVRLRVDASGRWYAWAIVAGKAFPATPKLQGIDFDLAAGGALASGKIGIYDAHTVALGVDLFDNFSAFVPTVDAAIFANEHAQVRWDSVIRENPSGGLWVPIADYKGDLLRVPVGTRRRRPVRFCVLHSRGDPSTQPDPALDDLSGKLFITPQYDLVPDPQ